MATPPLGSVDSLGSSPLLGSSFPGGSSAGGRAGQTVENHVSKSWSADLGQHRRCSKEAVEYMEAFLQQLAKAREPSQEDGVARQATIERLRCLLPSIFPAPSNLQLVPYGSFLSSCYSHGSDLDLALAGGVAEAHLAPGPAVELPPGAWGSEVLPLESLAEDQFVALLRRLADELEVRGVTAGPVTRILEARVPIIKFVESSSGIECDICVTTRGCDFKGAVMRLLHGLQPGLAPLVRLVKLWAKAHDINSAHCGTLNSWSLALMALFSMQAYPDGALLPPLWRLFHDAEPPLTSGGTGRPLQDKAVAPEAMLAVARAKCTGKDAASLLHPRWSDPAAASPLALSAQPGLVDQLLWFFSAFAAITGQWRDNAAHRNWRVSPWLGRGYTARFPRAYVAAVEEPFDCNDNCARSVGIRERNEATLPYIAWVFGHSVHLLRGAATTADAARALTWLFGPDSLPYVGLAKLQLPANAGIPLECQHRLDKLATGARKSGAGSGGVAGTDAANGDSDAEADARAFRALIDATRCGSPIMTLEEWRHHHHFNRSRPPHGWHRLTAPPPQLRPPQPPPPPPQPQPHLQQGPPHPPPGPFGRMPPPQHQPPPPPQRNGPPPYQQFGFPQPQGPAPQVPPGLGGFRPPFGHHGGPPPPPGGGFLGGGPGGLGGPGGGFGGISGMNGMDTRQLLALLQPSTDGQESAREAAAAAGGGGGGPGGAMGSLFNGGLQGLGGGAGAGGRGPGAAAPAAGNAAGQALLAALRGAPARDLATERAETARQAAAAAMARVGMLPTTGGGQQQQQQQLEPPSSYGFNLFAGMQQPQPPQQQPGGPGLQQQHQQQQQPYLFGNGFSHQPPQQQQQQQQQRQQAQGPAFGAIASAGGAGLGPAGGGGGGGMGLFHEDDLDRPATAGDLLNLLRHLGLSEDGMTSKPPAPGPGPTAMEAPREQRLGGGGFGPPGFHAQQQQQQGLLGPLLQSANGAAAAAAAGPQGGGLPGPQGAGAGAFAPHSGFASAASAPPGIMGLPQGGLGGLGFGLGGAGAGAGGGIGGAGGSGALPGAISETWGSAAPGGGGSSLSPMTSSDPAAAATAGAVPRQPPPGFSGFGAGGGLGGWPQQPQQRPPGAPLGYTGW